MRLFLIQCRTKVKHAYGSVPFLLIMNEHVC